MRVGVTGSSGLIGSALVDALGERGDEVVAFVRPETRHRPQSHVRWDPALGEVDAGDLARVGRVDALIHLAGEGIGERRWNEQQKERILKSRVTSTNLLAEVAGVLDVGFVACASAIGWYGDRGDEVLTERSSPGEGFLADVCRQWEEATAPLEARGVSVAHCRSGIVLSANGGALARQLPLFRLGLGAALGSGRQWMSPISLVDEVRAILWILDHRLDGAVNLVAPEPLTNRDFTHHLASLLHRPALLRVPASALRVALGREMADELILCSQRVVPEVLVESGFDFSSRDAASALRSAAG